MRKHRLFGVVFAMLLGTGVITQLPNPNHVQQRLTGTLRADSDLSPAHEVLMAAARLPFHTQTRSSPKSEVGHQKSKTTAIGSINTALLATPISLDAFANAAASAPPPPPPPPPLPRSAPTAAPHRAPTASGDVWAELRGCESNGNYSDDTGNGYYGAYQFSLSTWRSLGYSGLPSQASPSVQDQAAHELQARSGWGQWPVCSRRLGLS